MHVRVGSPPTTLQVSVKLLNRMFRYPTVSWMMLTLGEWPELTVVTEEQRFELVLKSLDSNERSPTLSDEQLQKTVFEKVIDVAASLFILKAPSSESAAEFHQHCWLWIIVSFSFYSSLFTPHEAGHYTE